jgi:uncharacterized surface protein with fasciclin (FAS1) repeats
MKTFRPFPAFAALAAVLATLALAACTDPLPDSQKVGEGPAPGSPQADPEAANLGDRADQSLAEYLQAEPRYDTFFTLLQLADVSSQTATRSGITVLAATNAAVRADAGRLDPALAPLSVAAIERAAKTGEPVSIDDSKALARILSRSLIEGQEIPRNIQKRKSLTTTSGQKLPLSIAGVGVLSVAGTKVSLDGAVASNGIAYPARGLIFP